MVKSGHVKIEPKKGAKKISAKDLLTEEHLPIITLRPNKRLVVDSFNISTGVSKYDAAKYSLLGNVSGSPKRVVPYDEEKQTGNKSISIDPTSYGCSFFTVGNIKTSSVVKHVFDVLMGKIDNVRKEVKKYALTDQASPYYASENCVVKYVDGIRIYKFHGYHVSLSHMLAHTCYALDNSIAFCSPAFSRYDDEIAIVKMKHPTCNKLLLAACDKCEKDLNTFKKSVM